MLTIRAMTGGAGYAQRHLEHSDYFDQNRTVQGEWHGRGAELLVLNGTVTHEQFEAVREGLHPETGEFLRPRHSADRLGTDGDVESKARSLYDLTFSAPKSVSVQALVGGDERLLEAHRQAVGVALQEAERFAGARVRLDGENSNRQTGNLVVASSIQTFRQSPDQGFAKLQEMGAVREVPYLERAQAVAEVYREMTAEPGRKVLVVAPTHEEIGRVTEAIREDLKQKSVLGVGETLQRHIPLQWTEAQKKDISNYQPDQVLVFHRASHGIEKYEVLTVSGVSGSGITAKNERGEDKSVSLTQARSFSVHERQPIEVAAGDKLLLMGNRREPEFRATNGELTTVRSVERGIIGLEDGRSVPANNREFTHGYAVTAHRSQGKTVDTVIISADVMKQELFYASASRGREGIAIITSDVDRLGESLDVSMARPSAIELAKEISQAKLSPEHGVETMPKQSIEQPAHIRESGLGQGMELGL